MKLRKHQIPEKSRVVSDIHGEYEVVSAPVDFIVIENLERYLSDQGRAKRENSRLMEWCHRAITQKLKMLAEESFGIHVLETPAAYSSRFCSVTGVPGFRATEVGWNDRNQFRWRILLDEAENASFENKQPSIDASQAEALFTVLERISHSERPHLTLLAPQPGGPLFVTVKPVSNSVSFTLQADINAAVNLALRAVAHPDCADIHHRLRTKREKKHPELILANESRRFGKEKAVTILLREGDSIPKERNTNFFYDEFGIADFEMYPNWWTHLLPKYFYSWRVCSCPRKQERNMGHPTF